VILGQIEGRFQSRQAGNLLNKLFYLPTKPEANPANFALTQGAKSEETKIRAEKCWAERWAQKDAE
jgi:hypothetical protein